MPTFVVYHFIHVRTPYRSIPKLFITDVPQGESVGWDLVDEYKAFGEFGVAHANHAIEELTADSDPEIKRAWRSGDCDRISYARLVELQGSI